MTRKGRHSPATKRNLREALKNMLSPNELLLVPKSFDIIGSKEKAVAVLELPEELKAHQQRIAQTLTQIHKNIKSVLIKDSKRRGVYRLREYALVYGEENTEVIHKEHGCSFKLDPRKVYFSPREVTERLRLATQVQPDETVLVMFSGIGPLPILIAKKQPHVKKVYAIELSLDAHRYCVENVHFNKVERKVFPVLGDVTEVCPKLKVEFNRVLMPLPMDAHRFLALAISCVTDGGLLHFYHWAPEEDLFSEAEELVSTAAQKLERKIEVNKRVKVLPYAPRMWKVRIDMKIQHQ